MNITAKNMKHTFILVAILGSAAGLNLGVMGLTNKAEASQVAVVATAEPADAGTVQVVVEVPVIVPSSTATPTSDGAATDQVTSSLNESGQAAPAPPIAQTVAAPATTKAPATTQTPATTKAPATTQTPATTKAPTTTQTPTTTIAPTTTPAGPVTEYLYYDFSGVASQIIVAQHPDGSLEFWSVTTESGWNYRVEKDTASRVELKFCREPEGEGEAKWELTNSDGELRVKKED